MAGKDFIFKPTFDNIGSHPIKVILTDDGKPPLASSYQFTLHVLGDPPKEEVKAVKPVNLPK